MVEKIEKKVQDKKKLMAAVGCLHFFSEDSIGKGYEIKEIAIYVCI